MENCEAVWAVIFELTRKMVISNVCIQGMNLRNWKVSINVIWVLVDLKTIRTKFLICSSKHIGTKNILTAFPFLYLNFIHSDIDTSYYETGLRINRYLNVCISWEWEYFYSIEQYNFNVHIINEELHFS